MMSVRSIMKTCLAASLFAGASVVAVQPASANITIISCTDLADGVESSCHMEPNIQPDPGTPFSYEVAESVYNTWAANNGAGAIDLQVLAEFDPNSLSNGYGSITFDGDTGTFDLTGYNVEYFAVKSSNEFWLFEYTGDSTGNWSVPDGQDMSHIIFFGSAGAIPEPATWALMILGFGAIGSQIRRRRGQSGRLLARAIA